jgi:hypothetical protein
VFHNLSGSYLYSQLLPSVLSTKVLAFTLSVLLFITLGLAVFFWFKKRKVHTLFFILALSIASTIGYLMFLGQGNYRYLIPLSGYAFFMIFLLYGRIRHFRLVNLTLCILMIIGAFSLYDFKNVADLDKSSILAMNETLKNENVNYVFCQSGLIQWQLDFYSNEKLIARYKTRVDRYPEYIKRVNEAFLDPNIDTGVMSHTDSELADESAEVITIDHNYFLYKNPSKEILEKRGFEF